MYQKSINYTVRFSTEERRWLTVLKEKYRVNPAKFIRDATVEKLRKEVPVLREKFRKSDLTF